MTEVTEVRVPDIGDFDDVPVIEIHVSAGDEVQPEDPLVTLESDKATMDVPAPFAGTVTQLSVGIGDRVSQGSVLLMLESAGDSDGSSNGGAPESAAGEEPAPAPAEPSPPPPPDDSEHDAQVLVLGARARAATRPRSAPPTSGSRRSSSSATSASAASA